MSPRELFAKQPFREAFHTFICTFQGPYSCLYVGNIAYVYNLDEVRTKPETRTLYLVHKTIADACYAANKTSVSVIDLAEMASARSLSLPEGTRVEYHRDDTTLVIHADEDAADIIEAGLVTSLGIGPDATNSAFERQKIQRSESWFTQRVWWWKQESWIRKVLGLSAPPPPSLRAYPAR